LYAQDDPILLATFGGGNDIPVRGDFTGDGVDEVAVYRPSTGQWFINGHSITVLGGEPGDVPVPADYDGDGITDRAVYRPSTGEWWMVPSVASAPPPAPVPVTGSLQTAFFSTETPFPCDATHRDYTWSNDTGAPIYLRQIRIWVGADLGQRGDIQASLYLAGGIPTPQPLLLDSWDHYAEPTNFHVSAITYSPHYVAMVPGQWLTLTTRCATLPGTPTGKTSLQNVTLYYTTEP
jgi:hypothetical protein